MFSFLLREYLGVELAGCRVGVCCTILHATSSVWEFQLLHIFVNSWYRQPIILVILVDVFWYLITTLTLIFLITSDVGCLFSTYSPFTHLLLWMVCFFCPFKKKFYFKKIFYPLKKLSCLLLLSCRSSVR